MTPLARLELAVVVRIEPLDDHLTERDARRHPLHADTNDRSRRRRHRSGRPVVALRRRSSDEEDEQEAGELHAHPTRFPQEG